MRRAGSAKAKQINDRAGLKLISERKAKHLVPVDAGPEREEVLLG
jgi:hypothetical protein